MLQAEQKNTKDEMPFGDPYAENVSDATKLNASFVELPNMNFYHSGKSCAFTSRRGGGKTHLLIQEFSQIEKIKEIPECLKKYERPNLLTDKEVSLPQKQGLVNLDRDFRKVWETVLAFRIARMFYCAIEAGSSNYNNDEAKKILASIDNWSNKAGFKLSEVGESCEALYDEIMPKYVNSHEGEKSFHLAFNRKALIDFLKTIELEGYLFIDDLDHDYPVAPRYWNINLSNMFEAIIYLSGRIPKFRIIFAFRREVYDFIQQTKPDFLRTAGKDTVKEIVWPEEFLRRFFEEKIKQLPKSYCPYAEKSPIYQFLGIKKITNKAVTKQKPEDLFRFALRHTVYRPRDFIILGNQIWEKIKNINLNYKNGPPDAFELEKKIRKAVEDAADIIISEVFGDCNAVIKDDISNLSAENLPQEKKPLPHPAYSLIRALTKKQKFNIIAHADFDEALKYVRFVYPKFEFLRPFDPLAIWGLVGWLPAESSTQKFNFEETPNKKRTDHWPESTHYFLHPAIMHNAVGSNIMHNRSTIVGHNCVFKRPKPPPSPKKIKLPFKLVYTEINEPLTPIIIDSSERPPLEIKIKVSYYEVLRQMLKDMKRMSDQEIFHIIGGYEIRKILERWQADFLNDFYYKGKDKTLNKIKQLKATVEELTRDNSPFQEKFKKDIKKLLSDKKLLKTIGFKDEFEKFEKYYSNDDSVWRPESYGFAKYLNKRLKKFGINTKEYTLVERARNGYKPGGAWAKNPLIHRAEAGLKFDSEKVGKAGDQTTKDSILDQIIEKEEEADG